MSAVLRTLSLAVVVAVAYGAGRINTAHTAPCRAGLL
jgi:hypothetical protein